MQPTASPGSAGCEGCGLKADISNSSEEFEVQHQVQQQSRQQPNYGPDLLSAASVSPESSNNSSSSSRTGSSCSEALSTEQQAYDYACLVDSPPKASISTPAAGSAAAAASGVSPVGMPVAFAAAAAFAQQHGLCSGMSLTADEVKMVSTANLWLLEHHTAASNSCLHLPCLLMHYVQYEQVIQRDHLCYVEPRCGVAQPY